MISLKNRNQGFTIVELLIVIVVIGILALLVITTYSGIQQKARNSKRQSDLASLQTQLEGYHTDNGYYPSRTNMNDSNGANSWVSTNMRGLDQNALIDPSNTTKSKTLVAAPVARSYSYAVLDSAGASCEAAPDTCAQYTLTATFEGEVNGETTFVKKNLD